MVEIYAESTHKFNYILDFHENIDSNDIREVSVTDIFSQACDRHGAIVSLVPFIRQGLDEDTFDFRYGLVLVQTIFRPTSLPENYDCLF
ncbi:unnamed protein product [Allacma fusca]|uniref:Uncharacterized protein n=1 Tax=Allacma fusca TaxID=39272 RepID=A0A8J2KJX2_9HEXA|nr:unnamed protein product [Allacma fusca]